MGITIDRRTLLKAGGALAAASIVPAAFAQDKPTLRFAAVFSDKDIRADMIRMLAKDVAADATIEPFYGGTLFKQGATLLNINIIDNDQILEADKEPEKYPDLVVRVTGFTAYFCALTPVFRKLVVERILAG